MNKFFCTGRLTKDPDVRWTAGSPSTCVAKFGIAVDRKVKKEGAVQVDFLNCTAWGKLAEHMEKYWFKGMKAVIEGRLEVSQWQDKTGQKRTDYQIVVEQIEFGEKKDPDRQPAETTTAAQDFASIPDGDEGIPFTF